MLDFFQIIFLNRSYTLGLKKSLLALMLSSRMNQPEKAGQFDQHKQAQRLSSMSRLESEHESGRECPQGLCESEQMTETLACLKCCVESC